MPRIVQWEEWIGRRLRLRDLYVFFTVAKFGSMSKAAAQLKVSTPAVSEVIADLEHSVGVRLLERSHRGVLLTPYGQALLRRAEIAFDELRQGVKDIEFLSDPTFGEVRIGCPESFATTILPQFIRAFSSKYPRVVVYVDNVPSPAIRDPGLRQRKYDLILASVILPLHADYVGDDLKVETLLDDHLVVAAGANSAWARRRKVDLADLADASWILSPPNTWHYMCVAEAFRAHSLGKPHVALVTFSVPLITQLLTDGAFVTALARSVAHLTSMKILPVELPEYPFPTAVITLRDRILSPVAERFIECARTVAKSIASDTAGRSARRRG